MLILNRWGDKVFEIYNRNLQSDEYAWDGTFKGKSLDPAVFVYLIEIPSVDGSTKMYNGHVTLIK